MSLINDALKRASKAQKGGAAPADGPAMQPALREARPRTPLILVLSLSLAVAAGCSVWLFLQWSRERDQNRTSSALAVAAAANAAGSAKVATKDTNRPADGPAQAKPLPSSPPLAAVAAPTLSNPKPDTAIRASNPPSPVKPAVLAAPPAPSRPFPRLKLQGILYSQRSPQAVINNSVYAVGDEVDGARVVKIERRRVLVSWDGREKALAPE